METVPDMPRTRALVADDLRALGVAAGDTLLVHSSLRSLGWVCGGAHAVVQGLLDAVGAGGTLVVPTHTMENSDPQHWRNPPVPKSWWPVIREHMPAFDPAITPCFGMGVIPELVRRWPGALRSTHPHTSFAAVGPAAADLLADHRLDCQLGEHSPLAALERTGAKVLLLGVGFGSCTSFHLAEYRVPGLPVAEFASAVLTGGERCWVTYTDVAVNSDDFEDLGAAFEEQTDVVRGPVGDADCRLFPVASAVAFAIGWLQVHRRSVVDA